MAYGRSSPASFYLFDILHLDGVDLTRRPFAERRAALERLGLVGMIVSSSVYR